MAEFEAQLKNSLGNINAQVSALTRGLETTKGRVNEIGPAIMRRFYEGEKAVAGMGREIYETGHALRGLGGVLGEMTHGLTGGFRFTGGLAAVAITAGVAGLAIKGYTEYLKAMADVEIKSAEATQKLGNALYDAGEKAKERDLGRAESQLGDTKTLVARAGSSGLTQARNLSGAGAGITMTEALRGLSTVALFPNKSAGHNAIEVARQISAIGEGKFDTTLESIAKDRGMQTRLAHADTEEKVQALVARQIVANQGLPQTQRNREAATQELTRYKEPGIAQPNTIVNYRQLPLNYANQDITSGRAGSAAALSMTKELDPTIAPNNAAIHSVAEQIEMQRAEAKTGYGQMVDAIMHLVDKILPGVDEDFGTTDQAIKNLRQQLYDAQRKNGLTTTTIIYGAE